jgi:hypothetical protein
MNAADFMPHHDDQEEYFWEVFRKSTRHQHATTAAHHYSKYPNIFARLNKNQQH